MTVSSTKSKQTRLREGILQANESHRSIATLGPKRLHRQFLRQQLLSEIKKLDFFNPKDFLFRYTYLFDFAGGNVLSVLVGHTTFNVNTGGIIFEELIIFQRKRTTTVGLL